MIVDTLQNLSLYQGIHSAMDAVCKFLEKAELLPPGRYELEGESYVLIHEGETRDGANALFEVHDCYLDLQVVDKGAERVEWANRATLVKKDPVDPVKDIGFYRGEGDGIDIMAGMFYLMLPDDAHKSICHPKSGSCDYRKYIFKLRYA